ncbi:hypothetical protein [Paraprevotella clara]|uniref:hypothetical protein n=1 Tax=Paraprevotella clara TaxID=454154 RepID=UPI00266F5351|nr:hypothetical protein [Paraprevotella clara]
MNIEQSVVENLKKSVNDNDINSQKENEGVNENTMSPINGSYRGKQNNKNKKEHKRTYVSERYAKLPKHILEVVFIIKFNAEIRRFTAKGIINTLFTRDEIKAKRPYVKFLWDKFVVNTNGLNHEYNYNETFFINSLIASFQCFAEIAQETINKFCSEELSDDHIADISSDNVNKIIELNKQNADIKSVDVED